MSMWQDGLLFADGFLYVKLMTEKSEKKMLFVKSVYCVLCTENSCFSIMHIYTFCLNNVAWYIYTNSRIGNCNKYS